MVNVVLRIGKRPGFDSQGSATLLRESVKKKPNLFGTLSQTMGRWVLRWVQSPKLFSENIHSVIFTANIQKCPKTCNT